MATLTLSCAQDLDDAHERSDTTAVTDGNELLCADFGTFTTLALMRFDGVTVPPDSVIEDGTVVKVRPLALNADDADLTIRAEDHDDSPAITVANGNISGRTLTTAGVSWVAVALGTSPVNSPNIKAVIQEVTDRPGWASGQALSLLLVPNLNSKVLNVEPFNPAGTDEPELTIVYTPPGFPHSQGVILG